MRRHTHTHTQTDRQRGRVRENSCQETVKKAIKKIDSFTESDNSTDK